jgi:pyruvate formate lyase activating enzyme
MKKLINQIVIAGCFLTLLSCDTLAAAGSDHEAKYYRKLSGGQVRCLLCPRQCLLDPGDAGYCRARRNLGGKLISLVYGRLVAANDDPIEKKPLYHFLPGTKSFSIATVGCSMRCLFCQNWDISQAEPEDFATGYTEPGRVVSAAVGKNCLSVSYTYSEPAVFYEYMQDISLLARKSGLKNVMVTSGHINTGPLDSLCAVLDAANVDLKGFSDASYRRMANTELAPILKAVMVLKRKGVWLELGYLVIPTVNDSKEEITNFCHWIADSLGPDVPLHFLRFFPQHKLAHLPPTPPAALDTAYALARRAGLHYVYIGNVPGHPANQTYCHRCGRRLIERKGYFIERNLVKDGRCPFCRQRIPGIWR